MKNLLLLVATSVLLTSCGSNRVEPNNEGVLMENYGRGGQADFKAVTGAQGILGPGTELYQVPMWEQKADPDAVGITAKDGGSFTVDPTYSYQPIRGKGTDIVFNYRHVGLDKDIMQSLEVQILNPLVLDTYREQARNYTTDYLLRNMGSFEKEVEQSLKGKMESKFFTLTNLTSGLKPPTSMVEAIERTNNAVQQAEQVKNELAVAEMLQKKASIDAETNRIKSAGLTKEVLQQQWMKLFATPTIR
jgi:regulator of protease activity HflC (stomatin/prohibitin superfamily)